MLFESLQPLKAAALRMGEDPAQHRPSRQAKVGLCDGVYFDARFEIPDSCSSNRIVRCDSYTMASAGIIVCGDFPPVFFSSSRLSGGGSWSCLTKDSTRRRPAYAASFEGT